MYTFLKNVHYISQSCLTKWTVVSSIPDSLPIFRLYLVRHLIKDMRKIVLLSFLGAVGYYIYTNVSKLKLIDTKIKGIKVSGSPLNAKLDIKLDVKNPSNYNIDFESLRAGVYLNNDLIGDIDYKGNKILPASATVPVTIPVYLNPVFAGVKLIQNLAKGDTKLTLDGTLRAKGINTPYKEVYLIA